ncbi:hypothetical protein [Glycomyces buryatensis]|uniref:Transposase n=1 Tax=Glycomyces buryatensis TaxID=2570927 RepID=A0A4S8Q914_9ACTN|nr:hypothetical protein [Glycomyces buryatensis]THV40798.1 hypothetical protein FAB82_14205 [Glycomyces buryatensis]
MRLHAVIDEAGLPVLGIETIDNRKVQYSWPIGQDRLRLLFVDLIPATIGSITGLQTRCPRLHVSEPLHREWAESQTDHLKSEAIRLWHTTFRHCEG